ncbi:MAG: hypothetical protein ACI93N_002519 [Flavobacteriaceae bacterium]|jgi:hypothetical protein
MDRENYCVKLAEAMSEEYNVKINSSQILAQLILLELDEEPTNILIGAWIKKTSNGELFI